MFTLLLILTGAALAWWWLQRSISQRKKHTLREAAQAAKQRWHAVEIIPADSACAAVRKRAGFRYLASEAPGLPLTTCTAATCTCRYRHFPDRRARQRRDPDRPPLAYHEERRNERRLNRERRKTAPA